MRSKIESQYRTALAKADYYPREIAQALFELDVFFCYLEDECGVTEAAQITGEHIAAYERIIRGWGYDLGDIREVLDLNSALLSLKLFCAIMHRAGVFGQDFGRGIMLADLPQTSAAAAAAR
jgi:hypothetical protein